ncbi:MAG: hypothetical protein J5I93_06710 [Pirellulaceae bacterium]|nr:hypothetical protein [Pirellulaceae bacterium]
MKIRVTVNNVSSQWSQPQRLQLQAAPLGAFVPWRDLGQVQVPAIAPGGSYPVGLNALASAPTPLGDFSDLPPQRLLTALASEDDSPRRRPSRVDVSSAANVLADAERMSEAAQRHAAAMQTLLATGGSLADLQWMLLELEREAQGTPTLPNDPFQLMGRQSKHWAGNINVLIGQQAVERHMAQALRIYSGKTNLATFVVGERADEYKFDFSGTGSNWQVALFDSMNWSRLFLPGRARSGDGLIRTGQWHPLERTTPITLAVSPPEDCEAGSINVHVRQRSTDREAVVEFSLDPRAAGPGCYTV